MKYSILILALALSAGAVAQDWVSVGEAAKATPSSQAPLVDSSQRASLESSTPSASLVTTPAVATNLSQELAWQVEQLQQEVSMLRGVVEQQEFQLNQLQQQGEQRYLDLDRRLAQLTALIPATATPVSADAKPKVSAASAEQATADYQAAMQLMREKDYVQATQAFEQFVTRYPEHELTGNALYWAGELWLVQGQLDKALAHFERVVSDYAEHNKAADASYKAGVVLHRQGKPDEAKVWLQKVIDNYAGQADSTVNLAKAYLQRLQ